MSAQKAQEQSMEDILASIRKIISEDSKEEPASVAGDDDQAADADPRVSTFTPALQSTTPAPQPSPSPVEANTTGAAATPNSPEPSVLVERREILEDSFMSDSSSAPQSTAVASVESAPETTPPETGTSKTGTIHKPVEGKPPEIENPPSGLAQSAPREAPHGSAAISGTVDRKLRANVFQGGNSEQAVEKKTPLHPAISNAKAFVDSRNLAKSDFTKSNSPEQDNMEKPVFAQSTHSSSSSSQSSSMALSVDPLISPDSVERREVEERRNHPLRRDADREEEAYKTALMSPQTNDAVLSAFEQLKNSTTDNLDGKVEALLRPMLREWLDNNLPSMVERLVRDEIERVSRGE